MQENIFKFILSSRYQTGGSEDPVVLVVHMTPDSVLNTDEYKKWMERFEFSHSENPDSIKNPANLNIQSNTLRVFLFVFLQVSIHNRTPDPQRTRQHVPQHQKPQDSGSAEHDSPRDLPTTPFLQLKGILLVWADQLHTVLTKKLKKTKNSSSFFRIHVIIGR